MAPASQEGPYPGVSLRPAARRVPPHFHGMSGQRLPGELSLLGGSWGGWEEASVGEFDVVRELPLLNGCKEQSAGLPLLLGEAGDAEQDPELLGRTL